MPQPVYRFEAGNELCVYIENPGLRGLRARTGRETEETFRYAMREVSEEEEEAGDGRSGSFIEGSERRRRVTKEKLSLLVLNSWKNITRVIWIFKVF